MLSKKTKYALKAVLALAQDYGHGPMLISHLARREGMPKKFLELILRDLKNGGILESKKGKGGGYFLRQEPRSVFLGKIIRVMEGPIAMLPCTSQTAYRRCEECSDEECCGIRLVMKEVRDETARILDNTSLADVLEKVGDAREKSKGVLMFQI